MANREVASRGRVPREQVEGMAQSATVLRHFLASVELCARGVALTLLDKGIHLQKQNQGPKVRQSLHESRPGGRTEITNKGRGRRNTVEMQRFMELAETDLP